MTGPIPDPQQMPKLPADVPFAIASQVMHVVMELIEQRARWVLAHPPIAAGFHRHVRRETTQGCACHGSSVLTDMDVASGVWNIRECPCTRWVSRDYPNGGCSFAEISLVNLPTV